MLERKNVQSENPVLLKTDSLQFESFIVVLVQICSLQINSSILEYVMEESVKFLFFNSVSNRSLFE